VSQSPAADNCNDGSVLVDLSNVKDAEAIFALSSPRRRLFSGRNLLICTLSAAEWANMRIEG
jgi:hypothetical protein